MDLDKFNFSISQTMNLQEPYSVQTLLSPYHDNLNIRFVNRHSKNGGQVMYMNVDIPMYLIKTNISAAFDTLDLAFKKFKQETGILMDFSPLDHILKHVNGHPLKGKITF